MSADDIGSTEYWNDIRAARQQKRASNRKDSAQMLREAGIGFVSKNGGAHLIVSRGDKSAAQIDFWPGTGRWIDRKTAKKAFGVRNLIKHIKGTP